MNISIKYILLVTIFVIPQLLLGQNRDLPHFRPVGQEGTDVFEPSKADTGAFDGAQVRLGGDFALQFQGLNQGNSGDSLVGLGSNLNLPTANLNLDVHLYDGLLLHMRTYLSSRHHPDAWVKGGHLRIDKLDFIKPSLLSGVMQHTSLKAGLDEFNYGDAHFRRSDNADVIHNPFVGNYLMDAFTTEAFGEVTVQYKGLLAVIGVTNGKLNQSVKVNENTNNEVSLYGKIGYDKQWSENLRTRLTGSYYSNQGTSTGFWLYGGDRAGARYYNVMHSVNAGGSDFEPRFNPFFNQLTAFQVNPYIKFHGLELFGIYEQAGNGDGSFTQMAAELLYRIGEEENVYIGCRYNQVDGSFSADAPARSINRLNVGGGWFITDNVVAKIEYVNQQYEGSGWEGSKYQGGRFEGIMVESGISF
jgi:hypothetical protein